MWGNGSFNHLREYVYYENVRLLIHKKKYFKGILSKFLVYGAILKKRVI